MTPRSRLTDALDGLSDASGLASLVERVVKGKDAAQAYSEALVGAAAVASLSDFLESRRKLKAAFGKDFSITEWNQLVHAAQAELDQKAMGDAPNGLICLANGSPKPILANAVTVLAKSKLKLAFDSFSNTIVHQDASPWGTRGPWSDLDDVEAALYLQHAGIVVGSPVAHEAVYKIAKDRPFHPVREWLVGLKWDGIARLENLVSKYFGCSPTSETQKEYAGQVSHFWAISAVARILRPGCIAKYMIVLEGAQDKGKSTALRALTNGHLDGDSGIQWFRDNMPELDHRDIGMYMQGVWIIEAAELSAIRGKEWERTKAFISSPRDTFRVPWGRNMQDYPRQCIFAGTTNEDEWGGDQTGLVRFWPFRADKPEVDAILRDRDQLWAEAKFLFDEGRPWYGDTEFNKLAKQEQDQRASEDIWRDEVITAAGAYEWVRLAQIMRDLAISSNDRDRHKAKFGLILRAAGWKKCQRRVDSSPTWGYERPKPED